MNIAVQEIKDIAVQGERRFVPTFVLQKALVQKFVSQGMSQESVAERLQVGIGTLGSISSNFKRCAKALEKLCDISEEELLREDNIPLPENVCNRLLGVGIERDCDVAKFNAAALFNLHGVKGKTFERLIDTFRAHNVLFVEGALPHDVLKSSNRALEVFFGRLEDKYRGSLSQDLSLKVFTGMTSHVWEKPERSSVKLLGADFRKLPDASGSQAIVELQWGDFRHLAGVSSETLTFE